MIAAPLCIAGMHRSGTSMVARILRDCGVWFGPDEQLMPAQSDNPDGFYEHLEVVAINNAVLQTFAGGWDLPPQLPPGWQGSPAIEAHRERAVRWRDAMDASRGAAPSWAFKDPRSCLTLPLWQDVVPGMRVIVCVRHPLAVAASLNRRAGHSTRFGARLWHAYHAALSRSLRGASYVVTHYDAWFTDARRELQRLLSQLGVLVPPQSIATAIADVRHDRRHHVPHEAHAIAELAGADAQQLYDQLCSEAGVSSSRDGGCVAEIPRRPDSAASQSVDTAEALQGALAELAVLRERNRQLLRAAGQIERLGDYRVGTVIDFRWGGNAPLYQRHGWSRCTGVGCWTLGTDATLVLRLAERPAAALSLQARVKPLLGPGHEHLRVTLAMDDTVLADWQFDRAALTTVSAPLVALTQDLPCVVHLRIRIDSPRSPAQLGTSPDKRALGLLFRELWLTAPQS